MFFLYVENGTVRLLMLGDELSTVATIGIPLYALLWAMQVSSLMQIIVPAL